jgi:hypothetical protein
MENNVSNATIGRHTRPEASTSGFPDSPRPPPSVDALGYVHRRTNRASETADKYGTFLSYFLAFDPAV